MFLTSEYSIWWLGLVLIIAIALSFFLYRNDKYLTETKPSIKWLLFFFRFISLFSIGFFLIKPLITNTKKDTFKPQLLILQDNSESIKLNKDSSYYLNKFIEKHKEFKELLEANNIQSISYGFSDSINQESSFLFNKKITNISSSLSQAIDLNIENNIAGILLLSDGIYNKGRNPYYLSKNIQIPIYTVGLGDTSIISDLKISQIKYNKISFSNQNIPFIIDIEASNAKNLTSQLSISEKGKTLFEEKISINKPSYYQSLSNVLSELPVGIHALDFELSELENEYNTKNNKQRIYINIIDTKQKILILYSAAHPDISAIKFVLNKQANFQTESYNIRDFKGLVSDYNLIILHQIPDKRNPSSDLLKEISKNKVPTLSIINPETTLKQFKFLDANIALARTLKKNEWVQMSINSNFPLFKISEDLREFLEHCPPLLSPIHKSINRGENSILSYQKIKNIATQKPAVIFTEKDNTKYGFILGEGLWKWKLYNYQTHQNFNQFSQFISKTINYLSIKKPKESFMVDIKSQFNEYESVIVNAQLYNATLEKLSDKEVIIKYNKITEREFTHTLNYENSNYTANLGILAAGEYEYELTTNINDKNISKKGTFVIVPSVLEYQQLRADHELLKDISRNTNAYFFTKDNWFNVIDSIKQNPKFKTKVFSSKSLSDLINYRWIFVFIIILLSIEWFIRKYYGTV